MLDRSAEAVFAAVLRSHQLRATISSSASYCDNWTDPEPAVEHGTFHLLDLGECWVRSPAVDQPLRLAAGDLVVFPHGAEHVLSNVAGNDQRYTSMLCGEFEFASGRRNPIVDALPGCFVVRETDSAMQFRLLAQLMAKESQGGGFGSRSVLDK